METGKISPSPVKKIIFVILIASTIFGSILFFKKDSCFAEHPRKDDNLISLKVGHQTVHLLGWYHGTIEWEIAQIAFYKAYSQAKERNCQRAQEIVREVLPKLFAKEQESLRVLSQLETIYKQSRFDVLGIEHAPFQYHDLHVNETNTDMSLQYLKEFEESCPQEISTFKRMYLLYPGPEYEFARTKSNIRIVPMGDDTLVKESFAALSQESQNMQSHLVQMSSDSKKSYEEFLERIQSTPPPDQAEIAAITKKLQEHEKRALTKYFSEVTNVLSLIPKRDIRFAEQIANQKSEQVLLVVGSKHLPGIKNQLQRICMN